MIPIMCVVQQGQVDDAAQAALGDELTAFVARWFDSKAVIDWIEVPTGSGYTAGVQSTSVVVSMQSSRPLVQSERETLLKDLSRRCMQTTGHKPNELVVAIRDPGPLGDK